MLSQISKGKYDPNDNYKKFKKTNISFDLNLRYCPEHEVNAKKKDLLKLKM